MTDHADLIARLRAGASTSWDVGEHLRKYQELCDEAADALSRPVTEEMVERGARVLADAIGEPVYTSETADVVRHILTAALGEPAAGHETYPGHDPAAGLPQPATEKGGDANSTAAQSGPDGPDNAKPRSPDTAGGADLRGIIVNLRALCKMAEDGATPATILALLDERAGIIDRAEKAEAEAARLREALTPSGETKAAYIGKFSFRYKVGVDEYGEVLSIDNVSVPWTTIKEIMAAIRARALTGGDHG